MKRPLHLAALSAALLLCTGCALSPAPQADSGALRVICTNFPSYDFVRQIAVETVDLTLLMKPGTESHTYEPTPQDMLTINNCDVFVYAGGDSDAWVGEVLDAVGQTDLKIVRLTDCVELMDEPRTEGMQADEEAPEPDEHVWTAPAHAMAIVQVLSDALCAADAAHADIYTQNTAAYLADLQALDEDFRQLVSTAARKEIIVGDRFPFAYFCREFGLSYYAAYPGCSTDTEVSAATVAFLIDKVKADNIPVVFHIELSNEQLCNSICEATGAQSRLLNAVHNVSADDFAAGATYLSLMEHNLQVLREALN